MSRNENPEEHRGIWSISASKFRWYVTMLLTSGSAVCGYLVYSDIVNPELTAGPTLVRAIITDIILSYTGAAIGSLVIIQWSELIMVLTHFLREQTRKLQDQRKERERLMAETRAQGLKQGRAQGLEQGRAQGLEQGRAETNAEWIAWNQRRLAAEGVGQPFDELPPASN